MSWLLKMAEVLNNHRQWYPVIWVATLAMSSGLTFVVIDTVCGVGPCR
jgi:hypothetical protein